MNNIGCRYSDTQKLSYWSVHVEKSKSIDQRALGHGLALLHASTLLSSFTAAAPISTFSIKPDDGSALVVTRPATTRFTQHMGTPFPGLKVTSGSLSSSPLSVEDLDEVEFAMRPDPGLPVMLNT